MTNTTKYAIGGLAIVAVGFCVYTKSKTSKSKTGSYRLPPPPSKDTQEKQLPNNPEEKKIPWWSTMFAFVM